MRIRRLCKKVGIKLLLEIFDYDIHRNQLIGSTRDALRLLDCLPSACSAFSLQVDLSHIPLLRESIHDAVLPLKGKIGHVHIGSCVMDPDDERYGDLHPYFGYARGKNDVEEIVQFLEALSVTAYLNENHKASLGIEIITAEGEDPQDLLLNAKRTLNRAWQEFMKRK